MRIVCKTVAPAHVKTRDPAARAVRDVMWFSAPANSTREGSRQAQSQRRDPWPHARKKTLIPRTTGRPEPRPAASASFKVRMVTRSIVDWGDEGIPTRCRGCQAMLGFVQPPNLHGLDTDYAGSPQPVCAGERRRGVRTGQDQALCGMLTARQHAAVRFAFACEAQPPRSSRPPSAPR
jgi:hypothetical protein